MRLTTSRAGERRFDAGAIAGRRWAAKVRTPALLARVRGWVRENADDLPVPMATYATLLTNRYYVGQLDGVDQFSVPFNQAGRLANSFWRQREGWPRRLLDQDIFVRGFLLGASEQR